MKLSEEVKDIVESRPTREERAREARERYQRKKAMSREKGGFLPRKKSYMVVMLLMGVTAIAFLLAMILVNSMPQDLTIILAASMIGLLILTCFLLSRNGKGKRITGLVIALLFFVIFGSATYFLGSTYAMFRQIGGNKLDTSRTKAGIDPTQEAFNIYITGIDQWEDEKGLDLERSDVNMIVTVNPVTKKVLLTSIPRDSYIKLHTAQQMDKLTHTGVYGVDETLNTVEDWLDVKLSYYFKMNFSAAVEIIDAIGGIKVYSPVAFESSLKGYKYKKGWNNLGGYKALYFARERHAFEGQDSIRVENQQRVMKAIIKKMTSSPALLTNYGKVMAAASRNLETDMTSDEMLALVNMQLSDLSEWDIQSQKIEGEYDMDYVASLTQRRKFSIYRTSKKSEEKCKAGIDEVMNPSEEEVQKILEERRKGFFINAAKRVFGRDKDKEEEK